MQQPLCPACGRPATPGAAHCPHCGAPQAGYTSGYGSGYGSPGGAPYTPPPGTPPPQQAGAYPPPARPAVPVPNPQNKVFIVVIALVVAVILAAQLASFLFSVRTAQNTIQLEALKAEICSAAYIEDVPPYAAELNRLAAPVPEDLARLVESCTEYTAAIEGYEKYEGMLLQLEMLQLSADAQISACAGRFTAQAEEAYLQYEAQYGGPYALPPDGDGWDKWDDWGDWFGDDTWPDIFGEEEAPGNYYGREEYMTTPMEVAGNGLAELAGKPKEAYFTAYNVMGREIEYYELMLYCYNKQGLPLQNAQGQSWLWLNGTQAIPADSSIKLGGFALSGFETAAYAVPYITYARCTDGTTWGLTTNGQTITPDIEAAAEQLQYYTDSLLQAALYAQGYTA